MNGGAKFLGYTAILAVAACGGQQGKLTIRSIGAPLSSEAKPVPFRIAEAQAQFARGNVALALESFRKALREDPRSVEAMTGIAASYDRMGRYDLSRKHFEAALAVEPANSNVLAALAASLDQQGKSVEAAAVRGEIRQRLAQAAAAAPVVAAPVAVAMPVAKPIQKSALLREVTKSPVPAKAVVETTAVRPAIQPVANRATKPPVKVAVARPAIQAVAFPAIKTPVKAAPPVAAVKPAIQAVAVPPAIAPVQAAPAVAAAKPAIQVASSPATIAPVTAAPAVAPARPAIQTVAKPATKAPVTAPPAPAAVAAVSPAPAPSITIKLPPPRPAAIEKPVQAVEAKAPVVPVPVPAKPAPVAEAVAAGAPKPSPAISPAALQRVAKANMGPRLERTSMSEVTLVTREAQPMWKPQLVQRTAQSATIRFVPLRLAQARLPIRILNAARVNRLAANTRMIIARRGWRNVVIGNAPSTRMRSIVLYPAKDRPAAQRLAAQLGFASALRPRSREVTVLLGRDATALVRKRRTA